jgi:Ca2+-transporting ATPase
LEVFTDSLIILIIVLLVAVAGFIQEYRAEQAIEALKQLTAPEARVLRDTDIVLIPAALLVPGDILILETGDLIPAG